MEKIQFNNNNNNKIDLLFFIYSFSEFFLSSIYIYREIIRVLFHESLLTKFCTFYPTLLVFYSILRSSKIQFFLRSKCTRSWPAQPISHLSNGLRPPNWKGPQILFFYFYFSNSSFFLFSLSLPVSFSLYVYYSLNVP